MSKKYYWKMDGKIYEVSKELHDEFRREHDRHTYLRKQEEGVIITSIEAISNIEFGGAEIISDPSVNVEEEAINNVMIEKLHRGLSTLSDDELFLIEHLIYQEISERELSKRTGIPQKTINDRKQKVLEKLKKFLEN